MRRQLVALLDACVLVPMPLADTLLRLAEPPTLFEVRWSEDILMEMRRVLVRRFDKAPAKAKYREAAMREFFPHAMVRDYQPLIDRMPNDSKDRHVLAAAIACEADYLVTFNLRDFPSEAGDCTRVVGPSTFLKMLWTRNPTAIRDRLQEQADAIGFDLQDLLERLAQSVPAFVETLRTQDWPNVDY